MADSLKFESSELEILETFEHEEDIQRPEELRFYTLDEQLTDFFEKSLPKQKLTRFEEKELKSFRDRTKFSYETTITITDTEYTVDLSKKTLNVGWIHPVYSGFEYEEYSYNKSWVPLFAREQRQVPNYYQRLINALPKPYKGGEGRPSEPGVLVDKEGKKPIKVLDTYKATRTKINDDGTETIILQEFPEVKDVVNVSGYFLSERPFEIPRPIDHPFLKSNKSSFVESDVRLINAYPSVEAIVEHAIPTTKDPYGEAKKYLDFYDITLKQISWNSWKERFPVADYKDVPIPRQEIELKKDENEKPSEVLLKYYKGWNSAYDPRFWLTMQSDGGTLVSKLLLSDANNTGSLNSYPNSEIQYVFPESSSDICHNLTTSFDTFLESGLYRPFKKGGRCIPITTILQEKTALMYSGRENWKETTKHEIVADYQKHLKLFKLSEKKEEIKYEKFDISKESERRKDILAILKDPQRENEDKAEVLENITRDLELLNRIFYDAAGDYVMCSHTLEVLRGILKESKTKFEFYADWTANIEGSRVCKFCGEEINNDTLVAVKEYDSEGHLVMEYETLNSGIQSIVSLNSLKHIFDEKNGGESLIFIVLSVLQLVPTEQQLLPIIQSIRNFTEILKRRSQQTGRIQQENIDYGEGLLGIAGLTVLLQTHNPLLIPKRKIGSKPFDTTGYPRDSDNEEDCNILKSMIQLLTFISKEFPILFKGSVALIIRKILQDTDTFKKETLKFIKVFFDKFKGVFEVAKEKYIEPEITLIENQWTLPLKKLKISSEIMNIPCPIYKTGISIMMKRLLKFKPQIPIETKFPSPLLKIINVFHEPPKFQEIPKTEIKKNIEIGLSDFPLGDLVKNGDSNSFLIIANQILTVARELFPKADQIYFRNKILKLKNENPSLMRDISKGILFELLSKIKKNQAITRLVLNNLKNNLTLKILLTDKKEAEIEEFELIAKERNYIKATLRNKTDIEREIYEKLLSLGIAEFIVTNKEREKFFKDYSSSQEIPLDDEIESERDYIENGNLPIAEDGTEMQVDYGDYGDRATRDYDDYTTQEQFSDSE